MNIIDLEKFEQLKSTGGLPSPKGPALAIVRYTQREHVALADLAHVVKTDPAFVGRLIKAANSVNAGGRRPIVSIHDALIVLGVPAVRSLALGFSLLSDYGKGNCRNFDYSRFWSRSLLCAIALQALTKSSGASLGEELFSVGLLSHIGGLALATLFSEEYSRILGELRDNSDAKLQDLEHQTFVMTHGDLTAAMLLDWGLPKVYVDTLLHLEDPEKANFIDSSRQYMLLHSLVLAEFIADICLAAEAERRARMPQLFQLGARLSLEVNRLTAICDQVAQEWIEWGTMLDVAFNPMTPFSELSNAPSEEDGVAGERMQVLLVDHAFGKFEPLRTILVDEGHEVFEAPSAGRGFEMALELRPQIMIAHWTIPGMDVISLIKSLRQTRIGRGMYILIMTDLLGENELIEALESGVDDFLGKALPPRVLAARLRAVQRVVELREEIERDHDEIRRFAAELAVTNRRVQELALTDILTGFPNRRYAMERMQQEWAAANRSMLPLACMVIDVDEFKQINDRYGHDVGDTMLKQVAAALKVGLRGQDVVCRTGGDEFLVICPATSLGSALACGERMRHAVESVEIMSGIERLKGSISVGVAIREPGMGDSDALIKRADQGVYAAKQGGRNRVVALQAG